MSFFKLMAVVGKMMIAPAVRFIKRTLSHNYHPLLESFFYTIGKHTHRLKTRVDALTIGKPMDIRAKELERSKIVEYGTEIFFGTFCMYAIAIAFAAREIKRSVVSSKRNKEYVVKMNNLVLGMKEDISELKRENALLVQNCLNTEKEIMIMKKERDIMKDEHDKKIKELMELIEKEIRRNKAGI